MNQEPLVGRPWGSPVEVERRRRILISVWAYAYEYLDTSLVDDHTFDAECYKVNQNFATGNAELDAFFRSHFSPDSGMWVHHHPNKTELERIAKSIIDSRKKKRGRKIRVRTGNEKTLGGMFDA